MGERAWICLWLALLLTGCAGEGPAADGNAAKAAPPMAETTVGGRGGGDMHAERASAAVRPLLEEEILAAYERAVDIYGCLSCPPWRIPGRP